MSSARDSNDEAGSSDELMLRRRPGRGPKRRMPRWIARKIALRRSKVRVSREEREETEDGTEEGREEESEEGTEGSESEEEEEEEVEEEEEEEEEGERVIPQSLIDLAEELSNRQLQRKTVELYSSYVGRFALYVLQNHPKYIADSFKKEVEGETDERVIKRKARKYYTMYPKAKEPLFKLRNGLEDVYKIWVATLHSKRQTDLSDNGYKNCRSALRSIYRMYGAKCRRYDETAEKVNYGVRVRHAEKASRGEYGVMREKDGISFEGYCSVGEDLLKSGRENGIFGHAILTTMWNLMSRVNNAARICKSHIDWRGDAMRIFFLRTTRLIIRGGDDRSRGTSMRTRIILRSVRYFLWACIFLV